jgi:hypothetical protein
MQYEISVDQGGTKTGYFLGKARKLLKLSCEKN